jgi:hypothetical protein
MYFRRVGSVEVVDGSAEQDEEQHYQEPNPRRIEPVENENDLNDDTQDSILSAIHSLEAEADNGLRGLVNPWNLDFWDPNANNYYGAVGTFPSVADGREETAWSTELDRYNLDQLNTEYYGTTASLSTTTTVQPSPSPWNELGKLYSVTELVPKCVMRCTLRLIHNRNKTFSDPIDLLDEPLPSNFVENIESSFRNTLLTFKHVNKNFLSVTH